jgi:hypothetical protein
MITEEVKLRAQEVEMITEEVKLRAQEVKMVTEEVLASYGNDFEHLLFFCCCLSIKCYAYPKIVEVINIF